MKYITSAKNPLIQHLRKLATSGAYRTKKRQTLLDGVHLCESYVRTGGVMNQFFVARSALDNPEVTFILAAVDPVHTEVVEVPDSLVASFSVGEGKSQVVGVITIPEVEVAPLKKSALLLDTIQDPGNVGTILRTAAAAGIGHIYTSPGTASVWSPKVLRAGMGAQFALAVYESVSLSAVMQDATLPVYATALGAEKSLYDCDLSGEVAWLFGSEGAGVSSELLALCKDTTILIPQANAVESMNVAAAVAVCVFEQRRQKIAHLS